MRACFCVLALLLMAQPAAAQTAINGTSGFEFAPSADHNALNEDGTQKLTAYQADIVTGTGIFFTQTWFKEQLTIANNLITVKPWTVFGTLTYGVAYTMTVTAVGPGGVGQSAPSDPFVRPVPLPASPAAPGKPRVVP